ncbi:Uu.00g042550.m01.CDS01 [Anthostomella pinea]|uniref:Uu.00g042550.m01.CDS01 n=1 Tax=Anthostomella pinea TaxID=933095 RepID=A0AAI8VBA4_9PEZI|nr:Uu.00g042550.m01.CDS01 [Anthostomella pinea]
MSSSLEKDAAFETSFKGFLRRQRTTPTRLPTSLRMTGQTVIITGSNSDIGLAVCRQLLNPDVSHLVMRVRSQAKGDAAASQPREAFPGSQVSV